MTAGDAGGEDHPRPPAEPPSAGAGAEGAPSPAATPPPLSSSPQSADRSPTTPRRRQRKPDPWAHRRGEPRVFAFLWTLFLFIATGLTFMTAVSLGGTSADVMRPATRALLAVTAVGIALLWPMVRLSQLADEHPVSGVIQDLVVVLIPAQAVVWPQWLGWLGRWPLSVVGAVAALIAAWGLLSGGLLALAQVFHRRADAGYGRWTPWKWMVAFAALTAGAAVPTLVFPARPASSDTHQAAFRAAWMLSPITAIYEVTRDRSWSGVSARVTGAHWGAIGLTAAASLPFWACAIHLGRGPRRPKRIH